MTNEDATTDEYWQERRNAAGPYFIQVGWDDDEKPLPEEKRIRIDIAELRRLCSVMAQYTDMCMARPVHDSGRFDPAVFDDPDFPALFGRLLANDIAAHCTEDALELVIAAHHDMPKGHTRGDYLVQKVKTIFENAPEQDIIAIKDHPIRIYFLAWIADHLPAGAEKDAAMKRRDDTILACIQSHSGTAAQIMHRAGAWKADFLEPETVRMFAEKVQAIVWEQDQKAARQSTPWARVCRTFRRSADPAALIDEGERYEMADWAKDVLIRAGLPHRRLDGPHSPEDGIAA